MKLFAQKSDIKCGVIGYGGAFNMGKGHLSQMQQQGMVPTAVAEIDPARLAVATTDFPGIQTFASVEAMLASADLDLVAIITPHNSHAALAMQCLAAGVSVVCEKPMAITLDECDQMIALAKQNGLLLSVYHNRHWDGRIMQAVQRIRQQGEIGTINRIHAHMCSYAQPRDWWRSSRSISGGVHYDWGVHFLEYAFQLIDSEAVEVSGFQSSGKWQTHWGDDTIEDEMSIIVRFANGVLLNLCISHTEADPSQDWFEIIGTLGKYRFNNQNFSVHLPDGDIVRSTHGKNPPDQWDRYYENIADAMVGAADLIITPEWSRRTMAILDLGGQSARTGRAIRIRD